MKNVIGIIPGSKAERAGESVVVSAHYDHLGLGWPDVRTGNAGKIHPGADDNASGVAVILELARALGKEWRPDRTVIFIAFAGEEAGRLGSKHYVDSGAEAVAARFPVGKCVGAINLDTVGRLGTGKLLALGTGSAAEWIHIFNGVGYVTGIPIQPVADDFGSSDQKSFLDAGVPAVQLFTGPNADYHAPGDTPDKIDAAGLVKVAVVAREAIDYLAGREKPMTITIPGWHSRVDCKATVSASDEKPAPGASPPPGAGAALPEGGVQGGEPAQAKENRQPEGGVTGKEAARAGESGQTRDSGSPAESPPTAAAGQSSPPAGPPGAGRRVSLGTVPDFSYTGSGVRITGTVPGSPAEKTGLREGDVITNLNKKPVTDLRAFSEALKALQPGDKVTVVFTRDGKEQTVVTEVVAR